MSQKLQVACIAGARPNFMKIAPVMRALSGSSRLKGSVIHTGQHYDKRMSDVFFADLGIPEPAMNLGIGSAAHGTQTGQIMIAFEAALEEFKADLVLVVGDVNSTIACALVAKKIGIPVAHVEAGLRSFDRAMPEEINRVLTDQISDFLFTTEASAETNLRNEGISKEKIHFVGNTMIDTLHHMLPQIETMPAPDVPDTFGLVTFHRPSNVDNATNLAALVTWLEEETARVPLVFPVHPRTRNQLEQSGLWKRLESLAQLTLLDPLPYAEFMALVRESAFVVTDSGGIQEETTWLGIPCLTQRTTTERPSTIELGTNVLIGEDFNKTRDVISEILSGAFTRGERPPLWDGKAAERIVTILEAQLGA